MKFNKLISKNDDPSKILDLIILTETWHDVNSCNDLIPRHNLYFSNVKRNRNDGVTIFVKTY